MICFVVNNRFCWGVGYVHGLKSLIKFANRSVRLPPATAGDPPPSQSVSAKMLTSISQCVQRLNDTVLFLRLTTIPISALYLVIK